MNVTEVILEEVRKDAVAAKAIELFEADSSSFEIVNVGANMVVHITKFGETEPSSSLTCASLEDIVIAFQSQLSCFY